MEPTSAQANVASTSNLASPALLRQIRDLGRVLDDLEGARSANTSRIAAAEREHGSAHPALLSVQAGLRHLEHEAELELLRAWRKHPLAPWAKSIYGLGEKSIARLIALTGDPAGRPNPSKLWAYCGYGDPERIRIPKGATQAEIFKRGNPAAKTQLHVLTVNLIRKDSPYRALYDAERERWVDLPKGHAHMRALRRVKKRFLRDLWRAARARQTTSPVDASPARLAKGVAA